MGGKYLVKRLQKTGKKVLVIGNGDSTNSYSMAILQQADIAVEYRTLSGGNRTH